MTCRPTPSAQEWNQGSQRVGRGFREHRQGYPLSLWNPSCMFPEPTQGLVLGALVLLTGHVATFLGFFQHQQTWEGAVIILFHSSVWKPRVCFLSMGVGVTQRGHLGVAHTTWPTSNETACPNAGSCGTGTMNLSPSFQCWVPTTLPNQLPSTLSIPLCHCVPGSGDTQ